ncbi:MAG: thiolase family protein [Candidatus Eiseniibacteriota bacterium]
MAGGTGGNGTNGNSRGPNGLGRGVVVAGAVRTAIGRFGGGLAGVHVADLGAAAAKAALARAGISGHAVDETIVGHARQAGNGPNVARQIAHFAGVPDERPAYTINKACASGLQAIVSGAQAVALGDSEVVLAGGVENMSAIPFLLPDERWGKKLGDLSVVDAMYRDGYLCRLCNQVMGETAETLVGRYSLSREEQDRYALASQERAGRAWSEGRMQDEVAPVTVRGPKGQETAFERDEHPRPDTTLEGLAKLPPVFRKDGSVHAGNSSAITDGAAAVVVLAEDRAGALGVRPQARIVAATSAGVDAAEMGLGPVPAVKKLFATTGLSMQDMDLVELNEAFASQVLACDRELGFDRERLNVNGGAIALGHPTGCSGTRIVVTLLHELERRKGRYGLATLCVSGGQGMAVLFERI